jgi:hypothetical protein
MTRTRRDQHPGVDLEGQSANGAMKLEASAKSTGSIRHWRIDLLDRLSVPGAVGDDGVFLRSTGPEAIVWAC